MTKDCHDSLMYLIIEMEFLFHAQSCYLFCIFLFSCSLLHCSTCTILIKLGLLCRHWATTHCFSTMIRIHSQNSSTKDWMSHYPPMIPWFSTTPRLVCWNIYLDSTLSWNQPKDWMSIQRGRCSEIIIELIPNALS